MASDAGDLLMDRTDESSLEQTPLESSAEQGAPEQPAQTASPAATAPDPADRRAAAASAHAAAVLMGVKLPIRILLGRTALSLKEVANLSGGSIVELDRSPDDPVEIMVNNRVIARGEVVVVAGNYGIRITEIARREEPGEAGGLGQDLLGLSEKLR
jgi:flagellar motor switch protein FliN